MKKKIRKKKEKRKEGKRVAGSAQAEALAADSRLLSPLSSLSNLSCYHRRRLVLLIIIPSGHILILFYMLEFCLVSGKNISWRNEIFQPPVIDLVIWKPESLNPYSTYCNATILPKEIGISSHWFSLFFREQGYSSFYCVFLLQVAVIGCLGLVLQHHLENRVLIAKNWAKCFACPFIIFLPQNHEFEALALQADN